MATLVGEALGLAYFCWALLLLLGCLGPHFVALGVSAVIWVHPQSLLRRAIEFVYGFINPAVYLLVFQPALFRRWTPEWLPWVCWAAWAAFWSARLLGFTDRLMIRRLLTFCVVLMVGLACRDAAVSITGSLRNNALSYYGFECFLWVPLYALPIAEGLRLLRETRTDEAWAASDFALPAPGLMGAIATLTAVVLMATGQQTPDFEVRATLMNNRDDIIAVSNKHHLEPRLIASIIEVTQRDYTWPFRSSLEELVTQAWLSDLRSHTLLAEAIDPSLGLAQVKANTVLTAYGIRYLSGRPPNETWLGKDYRSVEALSIEALKRIPRRELMAVPAESPNRPSKQAVVEALRTPHGNLEHTAFLLDLVATQWEAENQAWSIRSRADIMATIFQLGFDHSVPKPEPRANDFGKRVQQAYDSEWMLEHFAP